MIEDGAWGVSRQREREDGIGGGERKIMAPERDEGNLVEWNEYKIGIGFL